MNTNALSVYNLKFPKDIKCCSRVKLDIGTWCNYKCYFCYYLDKVHEKISTTDILKRIDDIVALNLFDEIDISGGEPTILPEFIKIVKYCKSKFKNVSCLTNGSMLHDLEYFTEVFNAGLSEILVSIHGTEELHNDIVGNKTAFSKAIQTIHNAIKLGVKVRINYTVTDKNNLVLKDLAQQLLGTFGKDIFEFNMILLNPWQSCTETVQYNTVKENIQQTIDLFSTFETVINVRYIPFCFLDEKYRKYIVGLYQHIYDVYDWHKGHTYFGNNINTLLQSSIDASKNLRLHFYKKNKECKSCTHFFICDGVDKAATTHGLLPITTPNSNIFDVIHYRHKHFER